VEGSQAQHQDVRRFYGALKELTPGLEKEGQEQKQTLNELAQSRLKQAEQTRHQGPSLGGGRGM
jgi:uncharacterized lipoprotein NlpE involved in copper resistance